MLWLFRYVRGFLKVGISGEYKEFLINRAMKNGIFLWDLSFGQNEITAHIGIKDFKYLFHLRKKVRARVKIVKKFGLPFFTHRYRKRVGFLLGAVLFFSILQFLSLFVWSIEVVGNKNVKSEEILSLCRKVGVCEGVKKSQISPKNTAGRILLLADNLAWCSVNVEGSFVTINVTETKNIPSENDTKPSNLIANEDGIITKIDVKSGNTTVKVGDAVAKGDILVSGIIEGMSSTSFVHSSGSVQAKIEKIFIEKADFYVAENTPTDKAKKQVDLEILGLKIPLYFRKIKGHFVTEKSYKGLEILGKELPFSKTVTTYRFTKKQNIKRSEAELKELLKDDILEQIKIYGDKNYVIKDEEYIITEKGIELKITAIITTDIASEKFIKVAN